MNKPDSNPREFWVRPRSDRVPFGACIEEKTLGGIHVIEYKAYSELMQEALTLREILAECCIDDCGFDIEKQSIEDLRDCMKAVDIKCREAIAKFDEKYWEKK